MVERDSNRELSLKHLEGKLQVSTPSQNINWSSFWFWKIATKADFRFTGPIYRFQNPYFQLGQPNLFRFRPRFQAGITFQSRATMLTLQGPSSQHFLLTIERSPRQEKVWRGKHNRVMGASSVGRLGYQGNNAQFLSAWKVPQGGIKMWCREVLGGNSKILLLPSL